MNLRHTVLPPTVALYMYVPFFQVWEVYIRLASERGDFVAANGVDVDNAVCAVGNGFY